MSGVELLNRFLNAYRFSLPLDLVRNDPSLSHLSDLGMVKYLSSDSTVMCDACDLEHTIKIRIDPVTDKLGWRCPEVGFVEATSDHLKAVRLLPDVFVDRIASSLQCQRRKTTPLIKDLLWNVGWYEFDSSDVNVYFASRIRDTEDSGAIAGALQAVSSLRNGLVIAPNISGIAGLTVARCRFAAINDLLKVDSLGLACDQSRVAALAGIIVKSGAGAPFHAGRDEAEALIRARHSTSEAAGSARDEAKKIASLMGAGAPSDRLLRTIIGEVRNGQ